MEEFTFRGHHALDLRLYIDDRRRGLSHHEILDQEKRKLEYSGRFGDRGEDFEYNCNEIFRRIYNREDYLIRPIVGLDSVCLGIRKRSPGSLCTIYNKKNCLGPQLMGFDRNCLKMMNLKENEPITAEKLYNIVIRYNFMDIAYCEPWPPIE